MSELSKPNTDCRYIRYHSRLTLKTHAVFCIICTDVFKDKIKAMLNARKECEFRDIVSCSQWHVQVNYLIFSQIRGFLWCLVGTSPYITIPPYPTLAWQRRTANLTTQTLTQRSVLVVVPSPVMKPSVMLYRRAWPITQVDNDISTPSQVI